MNILIATPYLPYPSVPHGGGQDLFHLIKYLGEHQHHAIRVVSFADEAQAAHAGELQPYVANLQVIRPAITIRQKAVSALETIRRGAWRSLGRRADLEMRASIKERWADVLYCAWTEMGRYLDDAPPGVVRVLDEVDVRFIVEEAARVRNAARRRVEELAYCRAADLVITRSARDLQVLQAELPDLRGVIVPPVGHVTELTHITQGESQPERVLFVGAMDRRRNQLAALWLACSIWPIVRAANPSAVLRLVGANPPPDIQKLGELPGIVVTGWVDNLRAEYAQTRVVVAPMLSEAGALNKIIDGLAAGRPVVATTVTNAGIDAPPEAILLADDEENFAGAIIHLFNDDTHWQQVAQAGRQHALSAFDWKDSIDQLESTLMMLVEDSGSD